MESQPWPAALLSTLNTPQTTTHRLKQEYRDYNSRSEENLQLDLNSFVQQLLLQLVIVSNSIKQL